MKSMTGYGRGECAQDGFKVTMELSSVNRKQTEISVVLPQASKVARPRFGTSSTLPIALVPITARA